MIALPRQLGQTRSADRNRTAVHPVHVCGRAGLVGAFRSGARPCAQWPVRPAVRSVMCIDYAYEVCRAERSERV